MRKMLIYILVFVILCFAIPIFFTKQSEKEVIVNLNQEIEASQQEEKVNYDYKQYNIIKVWHEKTSSVEEIPFDEYLYGVVSAEMPASFEKEALKAQAVVARTYTLYKIIHNSGKHAGADICDSSSCCQAWISKEDRLARWEENVRQSNWDKIVEAVDATTGEIVTYQGEPINAFFHSNSGGKTETTINVWGGNSYPYLQSVATAGEEGYSQYASEVSLSKQTFIDKIKEKHADFTIDFAEENCIQILEYTDGDRVKTIRMGNLELSGVEVRTLLSLKSANFKVEVQQENIKFYVVGYGHGVGMSQTGADSMAKQGSNYKEIIQHFYTGVEIVKI